MNFTMLNEQLRTSDGVLNFCQEHKLLATSKKCVTCGTICNLVTREDTSDGFTWRCTASICQRRLSIRTGTFFAKSKLAMACIIKIIYLWAFERASKKDLQRECGVKSAHTIADWKKFLRDICQDHFVRNPRQIGGPGRTVEIGETLFNRRKYNVGRISEPVWVFGGYDPTEKEGFLVSVPNRNAETLLPLIKKYILPGSTVVSDCWKEYSKGGGEGYRDLTANHQVHFVDAQTKSTPTHVVAVMWKAAKQRHKIECGTKRELLDTYLSEFMWRQTFGGNPFVSILTHIAESYPVN